MSRIDDRSTPSQPRVRQAEEKPQAKVTDADKPAQTAESKPAKAERHLRDRFQVQTFTAAGFIDVRWHMPEASGFYQPLVTARRATG
jgi:hypothetical protein